MTTVSASSQSAAGLRRPIPLAEILPWAAFVVFVGAVLLYFVGAEQSATSIIAGHAVHEFLHDGRHLLGFPCH